MFSSLCNSDCTLSSFELAPFTYGYKIALWNFLLRCWRSTVWSYGSFGQLRICLVSLHINPALCHLNWVFLWIMTSWNQSRRGEQWNFDRPFKTDLKKYKGLYWRLKNTFPTLYVSSIGESKIRWTGQLNSSDVTNLIFFKCRNTLLSFRNLGRSDQVY